MTEYEVAFACYGYIRVKADSSTEAKRIAREELDRMSRAEIDDFLDLPEIEDVEEVEEG